jgi:hypothetical protein
MTDVETQRRAGDDSVRVAVVQLESHPAAYISDTAFLEEPFLHRELGLSKLARHGFTVSDLQSSCFQTYLSWQNRPGAHRLVGGQNRPGAHRHAPLWAALAPHISQPTIPAWAIWQRLDRMLLAEVSRIVVPTSHPGDSNS